MYDQKNKAREQNRWLLRDCVHVVSRQVFFDTYFHCSCHYFVANAEIFTWKYIVCEIEVHHIGEDANHGIVAEGIDAKNVEVPQEARCYCIPPTTRGAHG